VKVITVYIYCVYFIIYDGLCSFTHLATRITQKSGVQISVKFTVLIASGTSINCCW